MNRNLISAAIVPLAAIIVGGCTVGPDYQPPRPAMPRAWLGPTTAPTIQQSIATAESADLSRWWEQFNDPVLDSLIDRALASNLDLRQAELRIRQARASRRIARAGQLPTVDSSGTYQRAGVNDRSHDLFQAGLDAAWEMDIFGGIRRSVEAADADIAFAVADQRDVRVTLVSEVALNYFDLRSFQRRVQIARDSVVNQQRNADLTEQKRNVGFVGGLDAANARASVYTTQSQIPALESVARQAIYNIAVLLNQDTGKLVAELDPPQPLPRVPERIPTGLPSDLLRRRPDIRRAEAALHAATARIGVATADLFPKFSLTGSLSTQSDVFPGLANWNNAIWSLGPRVSWPVFDSGRIRANIDVQNALQQQAAAGYENAVISAVRDVHSALIAFEMEQHRHDALVQAVDANRRALDLATQLYTLGQTDFINVLNAQRSLYATEDALADSEHTVGTDLISLYKALGGGWDVSGDDRQAATQPSRVATSR